MAATAGYDAFISYSHALDGKLAPTVQTVLERFAKPWYRQRALRVFRDTTSLAANPALWPSIEAGLRSSEWLILMASPEAARSIYVGREVAWWLDHKSPERVLVVLTAGEFTIAQNGAPSDAALPPALGKVLVHEPRWVDLRWLRDVDQVDVSNPRLRENVADIAAAIHEVPKDLLIGEHIRQHRRTMRLARGAVAGLVVLTVAALIAAVVAVVQRNEATAQRDNALFNQILTRAQQLRSDDVSLAAQLDALAFGKSPTPEAYTALLTSGNQARSTRLPGHTAPIRSVAYDPRGTWIASGAEDSTIRLWAPEGGPPLAVLTLEGEGTTANSLTVSPDGRILVAGVTDGTVRVWDLANPRESRPLGGPLRSDSEEPVVAVALSPDGRTLATGTADNRLRLWDVTDPARPRPHDAVLSGYRGLDFSPDGRVLAAGNAADDSVGLFDVTDPSRPAPLGTAAIGKAGQFVNSVAFSPDGRTMASGGTDKVVQLWNVTTPAQPSVIGSFAAVGNTVTSLDFNDAGTVLAYGSVDRLIQLVNVTVPATPQILDGDGTMISQDGSVLAVAFAPGGRRLVGGYANGTVRLWDLPVHYFNGDAQLQSIAVSPDGRTLAAAAADDPVIRIWSLDTPGPPTALQGHTDAVRSLALRPDGRLLASAADDGTLRLWDLTNPAAPPRTVVTDSTPLRGAAFSPDGRTLAGVGEGIRLWTMDDLARPPVTLPLAPGSGTATTAVFSPDGRQLAVGNEDSVIDLWSLDRPAEPAKLLEGHSQAVNALAVSLDGRFLASASSDQTVRLWDLTQQGAPVGDALQGHTNTVLAVAFSPDGHRLASGSLDHTVRFWNLDDPLRPTNLGEPVPLGPATPLVNTATAAALAYTPNGRSLAVASSDTAIRFWDLDAETLTRRICTTAANNLTETSWRQYFDNQPYQAPCG